MLYVRDAELDSYDFRTIDEFRQRFAALYFQTDSGGDLGRVFLLKALKNREGYSGVTGSDGKPLYVLTPPRGVTIKSVWPDSIQDLHLVRYGHAASRENEGGRPVLSIQ